MTYDDALELLLNMASERAELIQHRGEHDEAFAAIDEAERLLRELIPSEETP